MKVYYINFKGLESSIKSGFSNMIVVDENKIEVEKGNKRILIDANSVYKNMQEAEFNLQLYVNKRKFKLKQFQKGECNCYYCGKKLDEINATVDHIKSMSKYPELALEIRNYTLACKECNQDKSDKNVYKYWNEIKKGQMKRERYARRVSEKISRNVNMSCDNIIDIAKQDGRTWNLKLFFDKNLEMSNKI